MSVLNDVQKKAEAMTLNLMKVCYPSPSQIERMEELDDDFDKLDLAAQYGDAILKGVYDALMNYYPIDMYCEDLRNYLTNLKECQCAGAAAGAGNISSFAPENCAGVVDIHAKEKIDESKCMPRKYLNESRALPGGNLESKEKTDYENTLAEHNKNRKEKNAIEGNMQEKLKGPDCGANGIHDWDGSLKESYNFDNIYNNYSKIEE